MSVRFLPSGDTALTVEFGDSIDRELSRKILRWRSAVDNSILPGVIETVPTYRSLLIHYDPLATTQAELIEALQPLLDSDSDATPDGGSHWRFPYCTEGDDFAPDLPEVASLTGLSETEVTEAVLATEFHVYMIGFAPGQPYMGDLPKSLDIPRRKNPVTGVPTGSVVTATGLTVLYSVANPTGWYIIGRIPVRLFIAASENPFLLTPGDKVSFVRTGRSEFEDLEAKYAEAQDPTDLVMPS